MENPPTARLRYSTPAEAIVAENNTPAVAGILSALGILLISVVMLKGVLPRALAWLARRTPRNGAGPVPG